MNDENERSVASTGSVADVSQFANRESDRPKPIKSARLQALDQLSALDQALELQYGLTGNPMIKAQEHTPQSPTTPGDGTSQSECTEPMAWLVEGCEYDTGCEFQYVALLKEQADAAAAEGATVTPLYRQPPPVAGWQLVHECERLRDEVILLRRPATWQEETVAIESAFERSGVARTWPNDEPDQLVPMVNAMADEIASLRLAIRRLAGQDATLSVCDRAVTVTMVATLTDAEREVLAAAPDWLHCGISQSEASTLIETLRGLLERLG